MNTVVRGVRCVVVVIVALTFVGCVAVQAAESSPEVSQMINLLKVRESQVGSVSATISVETVKDLPAKFMNLFPGITRKPGKERTVQTYVLKFDHQKYYEESRQTQPDEPKSSVMRVYDGSVGCYYRPDDKYLMRCSDSAKISSTPISQVQAGNFLGLGHCLGERPLSSILAGGKASYAGEETISGTVCRRFDVGPDDAKSSYWVAPKLGCVTVRQISPFVGFDKGPVLTRTATSFKTYPGNIVLPQRMETVWTRPVNGKQKAYITMKSKVVSLDVNPSLPASTFTFTPPEGTNVFGD